jgi:hypothetical protein
MAWEVNVKRCRDAFRERHYWARNPDSPSAEARKWHWVKASRLIALGIDVPRTDKTGWEIDWGHEGNTGSKVWARNPKGMTRKSREWHWVTTGYLRVRGINTPVYRKDSWEVDWSKRNGKLVWARNLSSKIPSAREWHWVGHKTILEAGMNWKYAKERTGRCINQNGYAILTRFGMTDDEISLAHEHNLFRGERKTFVLEHRLVALKKYGKIDSNHVVRHLNGIKHDNRPENLVLGTSKENTMDHNTARLMAMYWRERCENAEAMLKKIGVDV